MSGWRGPGTGRKMGTNANGGGIDQIFVTAPPPPGGKNPVIGYNISQN